MSYFKILVGKDKFTLYDVTKDKHYIVEPEDLDHILDSDNPYNDDGSLNLRSYSDVINYYNRKNSKNKTTKALTKGYISKKANLKKEYQAVSSTNRKDLLRRKLLAQNVDKNIIDKIVKYPTKDVANDLRVDDNTKRILTDIIEDVDTIAPLDDTEKTSINSKYVDETKLEDKRNTLQDRNNLILNAYNALQANQRTMLNSLRTIRDTIPAVADFPDYGNQLRNLIASFDALNNRVNNLPLPNIPDYAPQLLELNQKLQTLTDAVNNAPAAIDYRPQFADLNNRIRDLTNALPAPIDYSRPLLELNNKLNALTDIVQNKPLPIDYKQEFEKLNNRLIELNNNVTANPGKDYTNDIKLLSDNIKENMKLITDGVNNLNNRPQIDYSADLKLIKDNTVKLIDTIKSLAAPPNNDKPEIQEEDVNKKPVKMTDLEPTRKNYDDIHNMQYDEYEKNRVNRNDNIERTVREQKATISKEWSDKIAVPPVELLRHKSFENYYDVGPAHSLLKLLNNLNDLKEIPMVKVSKHKNKKTNTDIYSLNTLGHTEDTGFQFDFDFGTKAPFKRIITSLFDQFNGKKIDAKTMLDGFTEAITRDAKPNDIYGTHAKDAYFYVKNLEGNPESMTEQQIEFASKLPSETTTITFEGSFDDVVKDIKHVLDENYEWKDQPKTQSSNDFSSVDDMFDFYSVKNNNNDDDNKKYTFVLENPKKNKNTDNVYDGTSKYNLYHAVDRNEEKPVDYSSMDEAEGLAKILGRTISSKFYDRHNNLIRGVKSGNKFDLSAILSNSINNTY